MEGQIIATCLSLNHGNEMPSQMPAKTGKLKKKLELQ